MNGKPMLVSMPGRSGRRIAGGSGGGKPDQAQAGGKDPAKLAEALETGRKFGAAKM